MKTILGSLIVTLLLAPAAANAAFICGAQGNSDREIEMCEYIIELEDAIDVCAAPPIEVEAALKRALKANRKLKNKKQPIKKVR